MLRATRVARPLRPSQLVQFVKSARQTTIGPHLAVMLHAAAHPDKEALVEYRAPDSGGARRMTWGEFDATINRLAHALVRRGVGAGRVGVMLPNGCEYLVALQALARLGATAVQIGYRSKASEIAYILDNSDPRRDDRPRELHRGHARRAGQTQKGGPMIVVAGDGSRRRRSDGLGPRPRGGVTGRSAADQGRRWWRR